MSERVANTHVIKSFDNPRTKLLGNAVVCSENCLTSAQAVQSLALATDATDLPPLKWSSLKYDFRMEDRIDGKEEAYG